MEKAKVAVCHSDEDLGRPESYTREQLDRVKQMIREGTLYLTTVPWYSLGPGLALLLTVFAFNLVGDGLRDALDPRSR